jgi:hypothetical protein
LNIPAELRELFEPLILEEYGKKIEIMRRKLFEEVYPKYRKLEDFLAVWKNSPPITLKKRE